MIKDVENSLDAENRIYLLFLSRKVTFMSRKKPG